MCHNPDPIDHRLPQAKGCLWAPGVYVSTGSALRPGFLLDSRVVDVPRSSNLIIVTLCSLKPLFFNGLKKALHFSDNVGA